MPNIFFWHFLPNGKLLDASSFEIKEDAEANNITKRGVMGKSVQEPGQNRMESSRRWGRSEL